MHVCDVCTCDYGVQVCLCVYESGWHVVPSHVCEHAVYGVSM